MLIKKTVAAIAVGVFAIALAGCGDGQEPSSPTSGAAAEDAATSVDTDTKGTTTIYLARHGETWLNDLDLVQGWTDSPLTHEGEEQAEALGCGLARSGVGFDSAYSADMVRHFETATLALEGAGTPDVGVERRPDLREIAFGKFEGQKNGDMWAVIGENMAKEGIDMGSSSIMEIFDTNAAVLSGEHEIAETGTETAQRAADEILRIARETEENGGGNVLVVSSGITIGLALEKLGVDPSLIGGPIPNGAVTTLVYDGDKLQIVDVNNLEFVEMCRDVAQSK